MMEPVTNTHAFGGFGTRTYGAYGHRVASIDGARTGFAGEIGEADLPWYLLGDRFYLPSLQRFASPDTNSPFDAGGLNRYAYCGGDPISRIDPSGEAWWEWVVAGLGLAAAVAATVVSAGALAAPIAAAAAGGLTATVSTTTMVTLTAAAVLDVVAVVAEFGAIASMAAGDEKAMGIFGWVALGTGVASAGLAGLSKAGTKAGTVARSGDRTAPVPLHRKTTTIDGKYYERRTYEFLGGNARVKHYEGEGALNKKIPGRKVVPKSGPLPMWHEHVNISGGINYAPDTKVGHFDVLDLMQRLRASNEKMPIIILSGAHGKSHGFNWANGKRLHTDSNLFYKDAQAKSLYARTARVPTSEVTVIDLGKISNSDFATLMNSKARIVHAYCYAASDWELMYHFGVRLVRVYS